MKRIKSIKQIREEQEYANRMRCRKGRRSEAYNPDVSYDGETFWRKEPRTYTVEVTFTHRLTGPKKKTTTTLLADGYSWKSVVERIKAPATEGGYNGPDLEKISVRRLPDDDYITLQNRFKEWYRK